MPFVLTIGFQIVPLVDHSQRTISPVKPVKVNVGAVAPIQIADAPVKVPATVVGKTVTVLVSDVTAQPKPTLLSVTSTE